MTNKITEALKLAEKMAKRHGVRMCDENGDTHGEELYCVGIEDIADIIREALADHIANAGKMVAEPVKQEPVALDEVRRIAAEYAEPNSQVDSGNLYWALCEALKYTAPVDAKAIRAEALEEAAKVCESKEIPFDIDLWRESTKKEMTAHTAIALAAAIRGLK